MWDILGHLKFVKIYLDDILIASDSAKEHVEHCIKVLQILRQNNASINYEKSIFMQKEIKFLGSIISEKGIKADISRVEKMATKEVPKNKKGLQSLIGYLNYFRPFVINISQKIAFLNEKIKKQTPYEWTQNEKTKVTEIFNEIKKNTLLNFPDLNESFTLETDASKEALGSIIYQKNKIIGIYSKKYSTCEKNYSNPEKEMLAIIKTLKHFRNIIYGSTLIIRTDHKNILANGAKDIFSSRIQRWKLELQEYNIKYTYIKGSHNIAADYNSRLSNINLIDNNIYPWDIIIKSQEAYEKKNFIVNEHGKEILVDDKKRIIFQRKHTREVLKKIHENMGHTGTTRLYTTIKEFVKVKNLKNEIKEICKTCEVCQKFKIYTNHYGKVQGYIKSSKLHELISTDIVGPYDSERYENEIDNKKFWLLTVTEVFFRYSKIYMLEDLTTSKTIEMIKKYVEKEGKPLKILSDRGKQFTSKQMKQLCENNEIKHIFTARDNPQGNGISERINSIINFIMKISVGKNVMQAIKLAETALNIPTHSTLKISPYTVKKKNNPMDITNTKVEINEQELKQRIEDAAIKNNNKINKKRIYHIYREGDECLIKNREEKNKLSAPFKGPFKIIKVEHNSVIVEINNKRIKENIKNVRPFFREGGYCGDNN